MNCLVTTLKEEVKDNSLKFYKQIRALIRTTAQDANWLQIGSATIGTKQKEFNPDGSFYRERDIPLDTGNTWVYYQTLNTLAVLPLTISLLRTGAQKVYLEDFQGTTALKEAHIGGQYNVFTNINVFAGNLGLLTLDEQYGYNRGNIEDLCQKMVENGRTSGTMHIITGYNVRLINEVYSVGGVGHIYCQFSSSRCSLYSNEALSTLLCSFHDSTWYDANGDIYVPGNA